MFLRTDNGDCLPKALIKEAVSLAGMSNKFDSPEKLNTAPSSTTSHPPSSFAASSLTNILSSALKLYSSAPPPQPISATQNAVMNSNREELDEPSELIQLSQTDREAEDQDLKAPSLMDFSKTLNTATRSAQSITQDMDMLQMNIESLANNLGIDPDQFDEDLEMENSFQDNYGNVINSANSTDKSKLYVVTDNDTELDKKNFAIYDHNKNQQHMGNVMNTHQYNMSLHNPPRPPMPQRENSTYMLSQQQRATPPYSMQRFNANDNQQSNNNGIQPPAPQPLQHPQRNNIQRNHGVNSSNETYSQLLTSMSYPDSSFGPNYPSSSGVDMSAPRSSDNSSTGFHGQHPNFDNSSSSNSARLHYYNNQSGNGNTGDNILSPGANTVEFNTMVNDYADIMRPPYYTSTNNGSNYKDS